MLNYEMGYKGGFIMYSAFIIEHSKLAL
jgi:hypothetical protein